MKHATPKPLSLDHFVADRVMSTAIRQWPQVTEWQRKGLVSIKAITTETATVSLTPKGRETCA